MTDPLQHECGLALVRLRKPLDHYLEHYGNALWGLERMFLLLEKQHNRGQDGAGLVSIRLGMPPGEPYLARERVVEPSPPWQTLISGIGAQLQRVLERQPQLAQQPVLLKQAFPFAGELLLGHLRYSTHGSITVGECHPRLRANNWPSRTLAMAGNFNLTNNQQLFEKLLELGQHPVSRADTTTVLERVGHFLDLAVQELFDAGKQLGLPDNRAISAHIARHLDYLPLLQRAAKIWDGGYLLAGVTGVGDAFVLRDPHGIRPGYWFANEDVVVVASERQAIATALDVGYHDIAEVPPAHALLLKHSGELRLEAYAEPAPPARCSFERIYFSRGTDADIYAERKALGAELVPQVLQAVEHDLDNTVFSYIPNTSQVAFWGLLKGLEDELNAQKLRELALPGLGPADHRRILARRVRAEHVILKDTKLRTFITGDASRDAMAAHVYDITYGSLRPHTDRVVCLDDSIVRGTTLRQSILRMLLRLQPRQMVIASSAPPILYPDCYGIDMSQIDRFIAFQAAVSLLQVHGRGQLLHDVAERIRTAQAEGRLEAENHVRAVYEGFSQEELCAEMARLLNPNPKVPLVLVYQTVEGLHRAIPHHTGDWYFTGRFPTPGGNRVTNIAFLNYMEGRHHQRAY